ncbi:MAG: VIT domain-containing protein [bacterium]
MRRSISFLLAISAIINGSLFADGGIIPIIPPHWARPVPPKLSISEHFVNVEISGDLAITSVEEVFVNNNDIALEGDYIFPLPENAAVSEFYIYIDGKKISAEVMDAKKAEQLYQEYIRKGIDPALLSFYGRGLFRARVTDIPAHGERKVEIKYSEVVPKEGNLNRYVYPLDIEQFTEKPLEKLEIMVSLKSDRDIVNVFSPSHQIMVERRSQKEVEVILKKEDIKPDKDLYIYYEQSEKGYGLSLVTHKELIEDGYFLLLMTPPIGEDERASAREIIFVIDRSGSMRGEKMEQVKKALKYCVEHLNIIDRFNIISFASDVELLFKNPVLADDNNKSRALEYIGDITPRGGTNINEALITAMAQYGKDLTAVKMLVFLTDGKPTVGTIDESEILVNISKVANDITGYVFGVGYDLNAFLLDRVAENLKGMTEYITPYEKIDDAIVRFYSAISKPALTDAKLDFGNAGVYDVQPFKLGSIFAGQQMMITGRYKNGGQTEITLLGTTNGETREMTFPINFKKAKNPNIPVLWATRQIAYYLDEIRLHGENEELVSEIKTLAQRYGIVTPYTSLFISEITGIEPRQVKLIPWGVEELRAMDSIGLFGGGGAKFESPATKEGELGVSISKDIEKMKSGLSGYEAEIVKKVEDVAFYLKDNIWVDARYKEGMEKKKIDYGSSQYFELLKKDATLARFLSVGKNVIVVWEGVAYEIKG